MGDQEGTRYFEELDDLPEVVKQLKEYEPHETATLVYGTKHW
jgi:hypothetical protein